MTIASTSNRIAYAGNGVTLAFSTGVDLVFFDATDLAVYVVTTATGVSATKVLNTDFTVSGGNGASGIVTMMVAPAVGETLAIVRTLPLVQEADFVNNDPSDAEVTEDALDKAVLIDQQLSARITRSFVLADSDVSGASTTLPTPTISTLLGWNDTATALQNYAAGDIAPTILVSPFMLTVLDDVSAAAARTTLGTYSTAQVDAADAVVAAASIAKVFVAAKGDLIGASANDTPLIVSVGADGKVLQADSTQASGLAYKDKIVSLGQVASTSGTSIDFTGIPTWAKRINVLFGGVSLSGTSSFLVQLGDAGGIENSGYLSGSGLVVNGGASGGLNSTAGFVVVVLTAANVMHGKMSIDLMDAATFSWIASHALASSNTATSVQGGGSKATSAVTDRVRITTVNGTDTFDLGAINVTYE